MKGTPRLPEAVSVTFEKHLHTRAPGYLVTDQRVGEFYKTWWPFQWQAVAWAWGWRPVSGQTEEMAARLMKSVRRPAR